jgi:peroxiredoxin Q/BCP
MLKVGDTAPDFTLRDEQGNPHTLSTHRGHSPVVLVFYPMNQTRVCTTQLCEMRDAYEDLAAAGLVVFGINPAGQESHQQFVKRHGFPFHLLVDEDKAVARLYRTVLGFGALSINNRSVYVVGKDGKIVFAQMGKPSPQEVLAALRSAGAV